MLAVAALSLVPADFTIEARGELQPQVSRDVFATDLHPENAAEIAGIDRQEASHAGHIVLRVAPGGDSFRVVIVDDTSEDYRVTKLFGPFPSGGD